MTGSKHFEYCLPFAAYPPPDKQAREHFPSFDGLPAEEVKRFMFFSLEGLFIKVGEKLGSIPSGKTRWYYYLVIELANSVGSNNLGLPSADLRF